MSRKPFRIDKTGRMVSFLGVEIPGELANVVFVRKIRRANIWYLATEGRRGRLLAAFDSERTLDDWWQAYRDQRSGGWSDYASKLANADRPDGARE